MILSTCMMIILYNTEIGKTASSVVGAGGGGGGGEMLFDLCIKSRLRILNGRILGDTYGKFTAHCSLGSSTIDYMICSEEIMNRFLYMKIHDFQIIACCHVFSH